MKKTIILLFVIVAIAAFLRFYRLAILPPSLEWDEVATGYDAYSILKTGRDQFGNFLPLTMRSLDDYKPPLYTYLTAVSIAILGWNDFAVRFPAALMGVLAILTTYGMTYELLKKKQIALIAALLLAVSPWHVGFSRLALETNSTIFFTTFGIWMFLIGLRRGWGLWVSAILFGLDLYLYHNARVFVPLLTIVLLIMYWWQIWQQKKHAFVAAFIAIVFVVRLIPIVTSVEGQMRFAGTSIFSPAESIETTVLKQKNTNWKESDIQAGNGTIGKLFHGQKTMFGLMILRNYLSHFDPTFWLFGDDNPRHHVSQMGLLYILDLPLVYIGLYFLFRNQGKKPALLLLCWLLFTPISAAVTRDTPHALRSEIFLPVFQILSGIALISIWQRVQQRMRIPFFTIFFMAYAAGVALFLHQYFLHFAADTSEYWMYGRKEAAEFTESVRDKYRKVYVSIQLDQPHMFFLYYTRYDPVKYLASGGTISGGWAEDRNHFENYEFRNIDYSNMKNGKILFVGLPGDFPESAHVLKRIQYLNGRDAIVIAD